MSIVKWHINQFSFAGKIIERVEITKETARFVVFFDTFKRERREANTDYFDTFDAAKTELVRRKTLAVDGYTSRLTEAQNALDKAKALQEDK